MSHISRVNLCLIYSYFSIWALPLGVERIRVRQLRVGYRICLRKQLRVGSDLYCRRNLWKHVKVDYLICTVILKVFISMRYFHGKLYSVLTLIWFTGLIQCCFFFLLSLLLLKKWGNTGLGLSHLINWYIIKKIDLFSNQQAILLVLLLYKQAILFVIIIHSERLLWNERQHIAYAGKMPCYLPCPKPMRWSCTFLEIFQTSCISLRKWSKITDRYMWILFTTLWWTLALHSLPIWITHA